MSFFFNNRGRQTKNDEEEDLLLLEREVISSAQADIDMKNTKRALNYRRQASGGPAPPLAAAAAASIASGSFVFFVLQNPPLALVVALCVGVVAARNPIEEDDSAGSIFRTVGRYTIASVEAATPKARALARAALTDEEEIAELQKRIEDLEDENAQLRLFKQRRLWVDEMLSSYSLQGLKDQARANGLQVGGTKAQLLMRLVEAKVINPDPDET